GTPPRLHPDGPDIPPWLRPGNPDVHAQGPAPDPANTPDNSASWPPVTPHAPQGDGHGYGYGYGDGHGYGHGYGDGHAYGYGDGYGQQGHAQHLGPGPGPGPGQAGHVDERAHNRRQEHGPGPSLGADQGFGRAFAPGHASDGRGHTTEHGQGPVHGHGHGPDIAAGHGEAHGPGHTPSAHPVDGHGRHHGHIPEHGPEKFRQAHSHGHGVGHGHGHGHEFGIPLEGQPYPGGPSGPAEAAQAWESGAWSPGHGISSAGPGWTGGPATDGAPSVTWAPGSHGYAAPPPRQGQAAPADFGMSTTDPAWQLQAGAASIPHPRPGEPTAPGATRQRPAQPADGQDGGTAAHATDGGTTHPGGNSSGNANGNPGAGRDTADPAAHSAA
ncbi:hypothetical protein HYE82_36685, partial [Streptomyces sp. BR123]|nr:hypothetical protein [Streptomyces sp. BR123]